MSRRIVILFALVLVMGACSRHSPTAPLATTALVAGPAASSPAGAVGRFAWAWTHRDTAAYQSVLSDDFAFVFAPNDSAGNGFLGHLWGRRLEAAASGNLFWGGVSRPPASDIQLTIDNLLVALSDPRPGKDPKWHRSIRTHVLLSITIDQNGAPDLTTIQGYALFYLVRGDSAALAPARVAAGGRDSTRWYIERWEDETAAANGAMANALPTRSITWGAMKALYAPPPARAR